MRATVMCGVFAAVLSASSPAATFPEKPVRLVVPYAAGGGLDFTTRLLAQKLAAAWGQPVVVENRPGSTGMVGAEHVVRAPNDGYTLLSAAPAEVVLNGALYRNIPYHPLKDLAPITLTAVYANVIAVGPSVPAKNWKELLAVSRRTPNGVSFGSGGRGSTQHLAGEWLKANVGINLVHVPYRGGGPAIVDLVSGQLQSVILGAAPLMPHLKSGRVRAIAVTTDKRAAALPDVPTLAEAGVKGFTSSHWFGVLAPAGAPREVIMAIHAAIHGALALPDVREKLAEQGGEVQSTTPEAFTAFIRREHDTYAKIIAEASIRGD